MIETHSCDSFSVIRPRAQRYFTVLPKRLPSDRLPVVLPKPFVPIPPAGPIASAVGTFFGVLIVAPIFLLLAFLAFLAFRCLPPAHSGFWTFLAVLFVLDRWYPVKKTA